MPFYALLDSNVALTLLRSEGSLACHTFCDTGHQFIMGSVVHLNNFRNILIFILINILNWLELMQQHCIKHCIQPTLFDEVILSFKFTFPFYINRYSLTHFIVHLQISL